MAVPVTPDPVTDYVITPHAVFEMGRRGLNEQIVRSVLSAPEQRLEVRRGRVVPQSRVPLGEPARIYLIRVIVDIDRQPAEVVTAYRTSRVFKYWRESYEG
jgi:hypothetical protein